MAKDNEMSRHGRFGIGRFEPIAQLDGFAKSGLGEVDVVNVRAFAGSGRRGPGGLFCCRGLWRLSLNEWNRRQGK
jgi:hypothetical protein